MSANDPQSESVTVQQALNAAIEHHQAGRLAEAEAIYRQILKQDPNNARVYYNLGLVLQALGQFDEAVKFFRKCIELKPDDAWAHNDLGDVCHKQKKLNEAVAEYRLAIQYKPDFFQAWNNLGNVFSDLRQYQNAIDAYSQTLRLKPDLAQTHFNLGNMFRRLNQIAAAIQAYQSAIRYKPDFFEAWNNLGYAFSKLYQHQNAADAFQKTIQLKPDEAGPYNNLGIALRALGQIDSAIAAYRKALNLKPDYVLAHSNAIYSMYFQREGSAQRIQKELLDWNLRYAAPLKKFIQPHKNDPNPERKLRIGYVSADFDYHASAYFLDPLLRNHNHEQFEIFCYANVAAPDSYTKQLQSYADHWHDISALTDQLAAQQIRNDGIDILVDLKLHTDQNRLLVFAYKPAPLQVTWLGYPGSTGLDTIDYRLTDQYLDSPDLDDEFYSEKSVYLPDCYWCYDPLAKDLSVNELPAPSNGYITFGCLNKFDKVNDDVLELWAKVLSKTPKSHFLLLTPQSQVREHILKKFSPKGVACERIEFIDRLARDKYLALYNKIDCVLDTFPCNGHTTTLDALWMGVPVVSLVGKTAMGRAGKSILTNIGLPELVADTHEQYMQIAVKMAGDLPQLAELRRTLRQRMEASPLMDAPRFTRNVESAYREMWKKWCNSSQ